MGLWNEEWWSFSTMIWCCGCIDGVQRWISPCLWISWPTWQMFRLVMRECVEMWLLSIGGGWCRRGCGGGFTRQHFRRALEMLVSFGDARARSRKYPLISVRPPGRAVSGRTLEWCVSWKHPPLIYISPASWVLCLLVVNSTFSYFTVSQVYSIHHARIRKKRRPSHTHDQTVTDAEHKKNQYVPIFILCWSERTIMYRTRSEDEDAIKAGT